MEKKTQFDRLPKEIQEKMLERQVEQGNRRDEEVFRQDLSAGKSFGGFTFSYTIERHDFWHRVLVKGITDHFYTLYPKNEYPKIMEVSDFEDFSFKTRRVVFMKKNNVFLAWNNSRTLEEAEKTNHFTPWKYARDIKEELVHLTFQDISDGKGVGIDPELIRIKK